MLFVPNRWTMKHRRGATSARRAQRSGRRQLISSARRRLGLVPIIFPGSQVLRTREKTARTPFPATSRVGSEPLEDA
jgi:hypothetical protein